MLQTLRIENLAVIESLEVEFSEGLNVLTGETGAGKSIILKSIDLLTGKKLTGSSQKNSLVRSGKDKAQIEGIFLLSEESIKFISDNFEEISITIDEVTPTETAELLVKRIIDKSGRSKFYINGSLMTQGTVSSLMELLVNITSQHEQKALLEKSKHRGILDAYGVSDLLVKEVKEAYLLYKKESDLLEEFRQKRDQFEAKIFRLTSEKEELENAKIKAGEREKIEKDLDRANASEVLESSLKEAISILDPSRSSGVNTIGITSGISKISRLIEGLTKYDNKLLSLFELIESSRAQFSEIELQMRDYLESLDFNSAEFQKLQTRLGEIIKLEKKYRKENDELVSYLSKITEELSMFEGGVFDEDKLEKSVNKLKNILEEKELKLTENRIKVSKELSKYVNQSLKDLGLKKAEFSISITKSDSSSNGSDSVQFLFNANPGEETKPLDQVASGGEVSRLLLAIKSAVKKSDECILQIFDEIDIGVSGHVAQVVGEKLKSLSTSRQVIIITHSAQVASLADTHIYIDKKVKDDRTFSSAKILSFDERLNSIAGMLAGKEVSKEFEDSARKLLER